MLDLKAQLGDYLDHVVERIDVDDIFDELVGVPPVQPVQPRGPRRTVPQWVYGVAAAAAVLLFVGGVAWLVRSGAPIDPVDQPTVTTEAPTTTVAPPTTDALAPEPSVTIESIDWTPIESGVPGSPFGRLISDGHSLYTLVEDGSEAELWASDEGIAWRRLAAVPFSNIEAVRDGKVLGVDADYSGPPTAVAVYTVDADGTITESSLTPTIPDNHVRFARDFSVTGAFLGQDGVSVRVAYTISLPLVFAFGLGFSEEDLPAGWVEEGEEEAMLAPLLGLSTDEYLQQYSGGFESETTVGAIGIGDTPDVVVDLSALGLTGSDLMDEHPAIYVSSNGTDWEQVEPGTAQIRPAFTIDGGLVAEAFEVTDDLNRVCAVSVSPDGVEWTPVEVRGASCGDAELIPWNGQALWMKENGREVWVITVEGATQLDTADISIDRDSLEFTDGRTLRAGAAGIAFLTDFREGGTPEPHSPAAIVVSADGKTWTRLTLPDEIADGDIYEMAVGADGVILIDQNGEAWSGVFVTTPTTVASNTTAAPPTSTDTETVSSATGAVAETLAMLDIAFEQDELHDSHGGEIKADLEYVYSYLADVTESGRWPEPEFDTSSLGVESVLTEVDPVAFLESDSGYAEFMSPPSSSSGEVRMVPFVAVAKLEGTTDPLVFMIVLAFKGDIVDVDWMLFNLQRGSGDGSLGADVLGVPNIILVDDDGPGPVTIGGLPPEASVIATTFLDGTKVWQRPVSGIAIFDDPDRHCDTAPQECEVEYTVLNAAGDELLRIVFVASDPNGFRVVSP